MEYKLVQRSTGNVIAETSDHAAAVAMQILLESFYGLMDVRS